MIPWWAKLYGKMVLARIPASYQAWTKLPIFRHGAMKNVDYAARVFERHLANAPKPISGNCLEVGPGDSLFTAINAAAAGFDGAYMVDAGAFASRDLDAFKQVAAARGLDAARIAGWASLDAALSDLGGIYLTDGLASLRTMPDQSVSFIFSQAVLEHVRKHEYEDFIAETFRVLKPGGVASHRIDLKDHLQAGLNNLRFTERAWESPFFVRSGFYTNRLTLDDHVAAFDKAGFVLDTVKPDHFAKMPIARSSLA
ncbi:MAG TPA: class I SAM-dependent methyltransferase, partial [Sphingomonas sp.]|nr:class I SAM-dependent methyltransferase [Sphingomonas sp.]